MMRVIVFTTFIDATKVSEENIQKFMQALVQIHPWEAPVVELS